ncbi:MAG: GNAT family N-acetyltransferase [Oligoflexia bacterium]|nr:GNAT family N-acetyltransferase [Oligoflexia bacterium]
MTVELFNKNNYVRWKEIFNSFAPKNRTLYHSPDYVLTWEEHENALGLCLYIKIEKYEFLYPFMKKKICINGNATDYYDIFSAYGYGGIISNHCRTKISNNILKRLNNCIDEWCLQNKVVAEFIREYPTSNDYLRYSTNILVRKNLLYDYAQEDSHGVFNISKRAFRDTSTSLKKGCCINVDYNLATLPAFIQLYQEMCERKKLASSLRFNSLYFNTLKTFLGNHCFIVNVLFNQKIIASSLNFLFDTTIVYHLSASDYNFRYLLPNDLMLLNLLEVGREKNCQSVFWGGGLSNEQNDTLFLFKKKFSTNILPMHIGKKLHNVSMYNEFCHTWEQSNIEKSKLYQHFFLKYHM